MSLASTRFRPGFGNGQPHPCRLAWLAAVALVSLAASSQAAVVFSQWTSVNEKAGNYVLTVTDVGTSFQWQLDVKPWNAEALGLFVDFGEVRMPKDVSVSKASSEVTVYAIDSMSSDCGKGCNLNGLKLPELGGGDWDLVFGLGSTGFDGIQSFSWTTSDFGFGESDLRLVGIRAQQLCGEGSTLTVGSAGKCTGSDKAYAWPVADGKLPAWTPSPDIPKPGPTDTAAPPARAVGSAGTLPLLLLGLAGLVSLARRRKA